VGRKRSERVSPLAGEIRLTQARRSNEDGDRARSTGPRGPSKKKGGGTGPGVEGKKIKKRT